MPGEVLGCQGCGRIIWVVVYWARMSAFPVTGALEGGGVTPAALLALRRAAVFVLNKPVGNCSSSCYLPGAFTPSIA